MSRNSDTTPTLTGPNTTAVSGPGGHMRWVVCALLFLATTTNYIDRQVIALLKTTLTDQYHWSESDYATIVMVFQGAYAAGLLVVGGIIDRIGVRIGLLLAVAAWTIAARAHGLVALIPMDAHVNLGSLFGLRSTDLVLGITTLSVIAFATARAALGFSEAANFPAAIKAIGEWFPKKERALATGLFNSGTNIGAITAPFFVPWIKVRWGWPAAFYVTGVLALLWMVLWYFYYQSPEKHKKLTAAERAYIRSDTDQTSPRKLPWIMFLGRRQTWAFSIVKFLTDPIWWFYLFWVPAFLEERYKVKITAVFLPLLVIYTMSSIGSIGGGWLSSTMIKRGFSVNVSRKTAMLLCALCVVPIFAAALVSNLWVAIWLIALAAAAHQGFSANIFTVASDTVPKQGVSSVVGIGGMAGAIGGMIIAKLIGYILDVTHKNYLIPFIIASSVYLLAVLILHLILPRLEPMKLDALPDDAPAVQA